MYNKMGKLLNSINLKLEGLIIGTALAASIQLALVPRIMSFYSYIITVYFLTGLISGYLRPFLSWWWGIWLGLPWIAWIFFNIASTGFKDGIVLSIVWLFFYSFPFLPACIGAFAGSYVAGWKRKLTT
jgi:hypothetical protein